MDKSLEIKRLIEYLNFHQDLYDKGAPQISDSEWDKAYFELKQLENETGIIFNDSPTQKVRYTVVSELQKVKHEYQPMLSLDKTKDIEEIKSFIGDKEWIAMLKLDGLTCRLTYEEGRLVRAETRGNGVEGEDITHNARVLSSIPQIIPYKDTLVVDGEVICDLNTFEQFKNEYANARNFAAGSIRLLDSNECAKRGLTFVAWDVITGFEDGITNLALSFKLEKLSRLGFNSVPFETDESLDFIVAKFKFEHWYPIDGIVFKWDRCKEYEAAGRTEHHFRGGLAYKFYDEEYETELLDIEWSMGRTGVLTPVAVYKDVEIDGAICNRANLHNLNIMDELLGVQPYIGQKIWVYKANQIIPQISRTERRELSMDMTFFLTPELCPVCLGETEIHTSDSGTQELYCSNPQCPGKLVNKLDHFCGKKGLDIKGLSKATLEKLIDWGWVARAMDLFYLHQRRREWVEKPGFGIKSVDKILDAIEEARHTTLEKYLSAISIPLIGKTYARQLAQIFETYQNFRTSVTPDPICDIEPFDFTQIDGFGPAMHEAIMGFDYYEADRMVDMNIIDFIEESALENSGNALEGKVIVITGKLQHFKNRDEAKKLIEAAGGKVTGSVSSKTNYLVNNDINSTSSKNVTAKSLGIPIITEQELVNMLSN
jgi:DNA ligase (NAD+)